jgi:hypothetical protein
MVTPAVGERLVDDGVDGREMDAGIDRADLDPLRRRPGWNPAGQIDLQPTIAPPRWTAIQASVARSKPNRLHSSRRKSASSTLWPAS